MKIFKWALFAILAIGVGLYPILYLIVQARMGFLQSKPDELLESNLWYGAFYQHIFFGGIALLIGWSQFSTRIRTYYLNTHRMLGKVYVIVCLLSGSAALYLAYHATGGIISSLGFGMLGTFWLITTMKAYLFIRNRQINEHQAWMIRSYALTWAAVMLRIYLPLSQIAQLDFMEVYRVIAWLCWVPNILVAEWIIMRMRLPTLLHSN
ncbi:MAG: DUF2306 domain-containing protein [Cyclobacteriaceae bacterium]|nr:DUF2306 domain-containing protein [Cyclobacteriaceae bacterium]